MPPLADADTQIDNTLVVGDFTLRDLRKILRRLFVKLPLFYVTTLPVRNG